jgi:hypothetical protein
MRKLIAAFKTSVARNTGRTKVGPLRRADAALRAVEHAEVGAVAQHEVPAPARRCCRSQAAARQRHLPDGRCPHHHQPSRRGAGGRNQAHRLSVDRGQGQVALRHDGSSPRARAAPMRAAPGWASESDLRPALTCGPGAVSRIGGCDKRSMCLGVVVVIDSGGSAQRHQALAVAPKRVEASGGPHQDRQ